MVNVDAMQFGLMPGKGTMDVIFIARQLQERQIEIKKLYFACVCMQEASVWAPRKAVKLAMRKLGVNEWLIRTVMAMYVYCDQN